jgi:hypothetical protein
MREAISGFGFQISECILKYKIMKFKNIKIKNINDWFLIKYKTKSLN